MFEGSKIHGSQPIGKTPVALEVFREVNRTFPGTAEIREWHSNGKKIFGWLCTYVPEEILHAGGILPVRITGYDRETELDEGNAYLYNNNCSFSRSCLQMGLTGQYKFLDGVVGGSTCDGARRLFDLWREYIGTPFHHVLTVPRKYTDRAHRLYLEEVELFKRHLEEHLGINITDESLMASIELYNQTRLLLKDLYELRKNPSPPISGVSGYGSSGCLLQDAQGKFQPAFESVAGRAEKISRWLFRACPPDDFRKRSCQPGFYSIDRTAGRNGCSR